MVNKEIDVRSRPCILPGLVFPVDTARTKHEACRRRRWRRSCPARVRTLPVLPFAQALCNLRTLTALPSVARRTRKGRGQGGGGAAAAEVRACAGRGPGGSLLIEASFCCLPSADSTSPTEVGTRRAIDDAIRDSIPDTRTHCHEITAAADDLLQAAAGSGSSAISSRHRPLRRDTVRATLDGVAFVGVLLSMTPSAARARATLPAVL